LCSSKKEAIPVTAGDGSGRRDAHDGHAEGQRAKPEGIEPERLVSEETWSTEKLLQRLATPAAGEAWKIFLRRHTALIVSVARHYHHDEQRLRDCYLFVCEKLCDDGFRRLLAYRQTDTVQFSSWLRAVVANLCVDWLRAEFGRQGRFRAIAKLPELEQEVYAHRFEQGLSIAACYEAIRVRFPDLTEVQLAGVIRRLNRKLTPRQHWLLATRGRITVSFDDPEVQGEASLLSGGGDDPENRAVSDEQQRRVSAALRQLDPQQRLLLQLRYQQGLTLQEVARLAGFDDLFRARYLVQQALARLQALLRD
jgi:RNA polymerase sigma factor (sigma-70 family)